MAKKKSTSSYATLDPKDVDNQEARRAVLDKALGDIAKRYGDGAIMKLGDAHHLEVDVIPTGCNVDRPRAGRRRHPARTHHRDLRPGSLR